jgi:hypothetical protein
MFKSVLIAIFVAIATTSTNAIRLVVMEQHSGATCDSTVSASVPVSKAGCTNLFGNLSINFNCTDAGVTMDIFMNSNDCSGQGFFAASGISIPPMSCLPGQGISFNGASLTVPAQSFSCKVVPDEKVLKMKVGKPGVGCSNSTTVTDASLLIPDFEYEMYQLLDTCLAVPQLGLGAASGSADATFGDGYYKVSVSGTVVTFKQFANTVPDCSGTPVKTIIGELNKCKANTGTVVSVGRRMSGTQNVVFAPLATAAPTKGSEASSSAVSAVVALASVTLMALMF